MHTTLLHLLDQDATQQPKASMKSLSKRHIRHTSLMLSIHLLNFQILGAQFPKFPGKTKEARLRYMPYPAGISCR